MPRVGEGDDFRGLLDAPIICGRKQLFRAAVQACGSGDWAEFGVYNGKSAAILVTELAKKEDPPSTKLHLFDSFEGLPGHWSRPYWHDMKAGTFNLKGRLPQVCKHPLVKMHVGWFKDTLPLFQPQPMGLGLIHIDCDVGSGHTDVFYGCQKYMSRDTMIIFDDFYDVPGIPPNPRLAREKDIWLAEGFEAFEQWVDDQNVEYEWLARNPTQRAIARILSPVPAAVA